jgi:hypothetical protein
VDFVAPNVVFFNGGTSSWRRKKERGIYTSSQNVAIAALEGGIIRVKGARISSPRNIHPQGKYPSQISAPI